MANYQQLKNALVDVIKQNGNNEITGEIMQTTLLSIINSLGANYQFAGILTPSTSFVPTDDNIFYLGGAGSYSNFGATTINVPTGCICIFTYNGSFASSIVYVGGVVDISNLTNTSYASLSLALADVPSFLQVGGLEIIYQDSTSGVYKKYKNTYNKWTTNIGYWQGITTVLDARSIDLVENNAIYQALHNLRQDTNGTLSYNASAGEYVMDTLDAVVGNTYIFKNTGENSVTLLLKTTPDSTSLRIGTLPAGTEYKFTIQSVGYKWLVLYSESGTTVEVTDMQSLHQVLQKEIDGVTLKEVGLTYPDLSSVILTSAGTSINWWEGVRYNNVKRVSFVGCGGNTKIYKITVNPIDNTASYEELKTVFGPARQVVNVDIDVTLEDNQYIGLGGYMAVIARTSAEQPFANHYVLVADGQNANIARNYYAPLYHVFYDIIEEIDIEKEYIKAENILLYGDSITNGYRPGGTYPPYYGQQIQRKTNCTRVIKQGYDSALCTQGVSGASNGFLSTDDRLNALIAQSPDVVFAVFGTNDYQLNAPIGTIADDSVETFIGALKYIITKIKTSLPDCMLILGTPNPYYYVMASGTRNSGRTANNAGNTLMDYAEAIRKVCAYYSIPCADITNNVGYLDTTNISAGYSTDGVHLTEKGYERMTDVLVSKYKEVFNK